MAIQRNLKHIAGLDEVDKLLDSLVDPKFRGRALRNAGRKAMKPVKETLESKLPVGGDEEDSYKHYQSSYGTGYSPGDLRKGVKLQITTNSDKDIKVSKSGKIKDKQKSELYANVTFERHLLKLAGILENGRQKRVAKTRNGKVFHAWGKPTDATHRDIGTTAPRNFISETFAQHESSIVEEFKRELELSIKRQVKAYERKQKKNK